MQSAVTSREKPTRRRRLVSRPPLNPSSFRTVQPDRLDRIRLFASSSSRGNNEMRLRYELTVVDQNVDDPEVAQAVELPCAVFLVPAGREAEYLFRTRKGLLNVAQSAKSIRLIAVGFQRSWEPPFAAAAAGRPHGGRGGGISEHDDDGYIDQENVRAELTETVQLIAQKGRYLSTMSRISKSNLSPQIVKYQTDAEAQGGNFQIPFMAIDGIGERNIIASGDTESTGPYVVEEVMIDGGDNVRRLYFMNRPNLIQTEVFLLPDSDISGSVVDKTRLASEYHKYIVAGYVLLGDVPSLPPTPTEAPIPTNAGEDEESMASSSGGHPRKGMVIGLGGGSLVNFLLEFFRGALHVTVVELDPGIVHIASSYFDCQQGESMEVFVGDGLMVRSCPSSSATGENMKLEEGGEKAIHGEAADDLLHTCSASDGYAPTQRLNIGSDSPAEPQGSLRFPSESFSLIVIDVDTKDMTVGMSCPPVEFVDVDYLRRLQVLLADKGSVLAVNVAARDPDMLALVKANVSEAFSPPSWSLYVAGEDHDDVYYNYGEGGRGEGDDAINVVIFARRDDSMVEIGEEGGEVGDSSACLPTAEARTEKINRLWDESKFHDVVLRRELEDCAIEIERMTVVEPPRTENMGSDPKKGRKGSPKRKGKGGKKKGKRK